MMAVGKHLGGYGLAVLLTKRKCSEAFPLQFPRRRWNFTSPSAPTLRWAQIWQRASNYPARLPTKPTSHRRMWEPLPSWRPVGISPHAPAAPGAAFITPSQRKLGPLSAEEEQEKHPRTKQPERHFQLSWRACWPPPAQHLLPVPLCLSPTCPCCRRLFTRGGLPLGVGSDILFRNGNPNPWEPERDAMQYLGQARDCQELQAATTTSSETRAEESTAPWRGDLASRPLPAPAWLWRLKLGPFPSIQHL